MRLRRFSLLGTLVLVALMASAAAMMAGPRGVVAQASPETTPEFVASPAVLPGVQQVAARSYSGDIKSIVAAVATPATPGDMTPMVVTMSAVVTQFDSEADAAGAFDAARQHLIGPASTGGIALEEVEVEGFSGPTNAYAASIVQGEGITLHQVVLITQDGPYIYQTIVVALSSVADAQEIAVDVAKAMIATPAGTGAATFVEDGSSTGGIWDKFPKAGDPVLQGLTPEFDDRSEPAS